MDPELRQETRKLRRRRIEKLAALLRLTAVSAVNDRRLTLKALETAVQRRCPDRVSCITPTVAARTCGDYQTYLARSADGGRFRHETGVTVTASV